MDVITDEASQCFLSGSYGSATVLETILVLDWCGACSSAHTLPNPRVSNTEVRAQAQSFLKNILDTNLLS